MIAMFVHFSTRVKISSKSSTARVDEDVCAFSVTSYIGVSEMTATQRGQEQVWMPFSGDVFRKKKLLFFTDTVLGCVAVFSMMKKQFLKGPSQAC